MGPENRALTTNEWLNSYPFQTQVIKLKLSPVWRQTGVYIADLRHWLCSAWLQYFAVHVAGQEWRVDPRVPPGVRLHAVTTLRSQAGGQQVVLGAI